MTSPHPALAPGPGRSRPRPAPVPDPPLSVWATAQQDARTQRRGRYLPASTAHPAKMLPAIAATAITRYTAPGDLVADPMCGIGTTLVEAIHLGRDGIGVEFEDRWASIAAANIAHARAPARRGTAGVFGGDAGQWPALLPPGWPGAPPWWSPPRRTVPACTARSAPSSGTAAAGSRNTTTATSTSHATATT